VRRLPPRLLHAPRSSPEALPEHPRRPRTLCRGRSRTSAADGRCRGGHYAAGAGDPVADAEVPHHVAGAAGRHVIGVAPSTAAQREIGESTALYTTWIPATTR
jgi:hypothetical protein